MIRTSLFELFKIGPGPSSSHTVGPMIASKRFRDAIIHYLETHQILDSKIKIKVDLYGSLADTGRGHGTHRAILAGLHGFSPIDVNIDDLNTYFSESSTGYRIPFLSNHSQMTEEDIVFHYHENPYKHPNSFKMAAYIDFNLIHESIFYSIGGGFIEEEGASAEQSQKGIPVYPYSNMSEFLLLCDSEKKSHLEILYENEIAISGIDQNEINRRIDSILNAMSASVERGLNSVGTLPGGLYVSRRAKSMYEQAKKLESNGNAANAQFTKMNAYALAVSEENAAGHMVVTAPTNGAAGIIPAMLEYLKRDCQISLEERRHALVSAALIGFIIKQNASISGAELGCQAEVGSASAMAAAALTYVFTKDIAIISSAAEIALEHSLGMTCDPINGLVQIPCIERNAAGTIKAYNAYLLASARDSKPIITLDQVIKVMKQTGLDLSEKYRETSTGGLAIYGWGNSPGS